MFIVHLQTLKAKRSILNFSCPHIRCLRSNIKCNWFQKHLYCGYCGVCLMFNVYCKQWHSHIIKHQVFQNQSITEIKCFSHFAMNSEWMQKIRSYKTISIVVNRIKCIFIFILFIQNICDVIVSLYMTYVPFTFSCWVKNRLVTTTKKLHCTKSENGRGWRKIKKKRTTILLKQQKNGQIICKVTQI